MLATEVAAILAALNSPIGWWRAWRTAVHGKDEALRFIASFTEDWPVSTFNTEQRDSLTPRTEALLDLSPSIREADRAIGDWLLTEIGVSKLTRQLAAASSLLDADAFVAAIRAVLPRRRALSAAELKRLRDEHAATLAPAREARLQAVGHERAVSDIVNSAYRLTPEEVTLMWATAPPRMPLRKR